MERYDNATCPYCGLENMVRSDSLEPHTTTIYCDVDEGGCEEEFSVYINFVAEVEVSTLQVVPPEVLKKKRQEFQGKQKQIPTGRGDAI